MVTPVEDKTIQSKLSHELAIENWLYSDSVRRFLFLLSLADLAYNIYFLNISYLAVRAGVVASLMYIISLVDLYTTKELAKYPGALEKYDETNPEFILEEVSQWNAFELLFKESDGESTLLYLMGLFGAFPFTAAPWFLHRYLSIRINLIYAEIEENERN